MTTVLSKQVMLHTARHMPIWRIEPNEVVKLYNKYKQKPSQLHSEWIHAMADHMQHYASLDIKPNLYATVFAKQLAGGRVFATIKYTSNKQRSCSMQLNGMQRLDTTIGEIADSYMLKVCNVIDGLGYSALQDASILELPGYKQTSNIPLSAYARKLYGKDIAYLLYGIPTILN